MKKQIYPLGVLFFIVFMVAVSSCKKDKIVQNPNDKEYFPLKVGSSIIYDVDSINFYDITLTSDTFRWQIKETVDSMFIDDTNSPAYILYRYKRFSTGQQWIPYRVWSAKVDNFMATKQEENLRFIKLVFPVYQHQTWKGNAFLKDSTSIYTKDWDYTYTNVDTTYVLNNTPLDSSLIVVQQYNVNLVQKDIEKESYAKNVGLIYKESTHVERQNVTPDWKPEKGTIVIYRYNSRS